ncbi:MAG: ABC transporter ATP-binding protein [Planctomycetota bacterium]
MTLAASDVSFAYDRQPVLRGVSAALEPGSVTAIIGPNGAGKSTLLRLLLGLDKPASGAVMLDRDPVHAIPAPIRARRMAFVAQRPDAAFGFSVSQTVVFARHAVGPDPEAVGRALALVELADRAREPFAELSVGQQQRAALARGFAQLDVESDEPRFLLADEPVSAMDPRHAGRSLGLIQGLATRGIGVGIVLHDLTAARAFSDRAVLLDGAGRVAHAGPTPEVITPRRLEPVFATRFLEVEHPELPTPALIPAAVPAPTPGSGSASTLKA